MVAAKLPLVRDSSGSTPEVTLRVRKFTRVAKQKLEHSDVACWLHDLALKVSQCASEDLQLTALIAAPFN